MTLFNISFMICLFGFHTSVWCQQNHYRNLNTIYHVSSNAQNWFQAFIMCKNAGMDLASITSKDQHDKLEEYLKNNSYNPALNISTGTVTKISQKIKTVSP
ncbi:hypothetical protein GWI33_012515 [Rhynchophorus ferrugineus]|uniref:C-type lectin n=1 Tax=Rhynchophorus ferrugineus TaxID=354439 RepID=A0A834M8P8_RHYFE|nr:hypothetical protein GWI33_012515 [Rhynchophorus ferrugineus]